MTDFERDLFLDSEHVATKASENELVVEGYFATYDLDHQKERWVPNSFGPAIKAFMKNPSRPVLYEHKRELGQFGTVDHLEERPGGLWGRMRLPRPSSGVLRQAWEAVAAGITRGVSVHAPMMMSRQSDGTAVLIPKRIKEFSITPFPINETSVVAVATKAFADDTDDDEEAIKAIRAEFDARIATIDAELTRQEGLLADDQTGD